MANLEAENRELRLRLQSLKDDARHNEVLLERALDRELDLLEIDSLAELLVALTEGLQDAFALADVTLHLCDPEHQLRNLFEQAGLNRGMFPKVRVFDHPRDLPPALQHLKSPRLGRFLGHSHGELFDPERVIRSVALLPLTRGTVRGCISLGSAEPQRYTHHHSTDLLHRLGIIAAVCLENAIYREQLIIHGYTDPLTNLRNRRYLEIRLQEEVAGCLRHRKPLSCLFLDADYFKRINDRYGHATGDIVLRELGFCLTRQLRACDTASRYGGEEFAVLLPHTDGEAAAGLAERIRTAVAALDLCSQTRESVSITASIGVSTFAAPPMGTRVDTLTAKEIGHGLLNSADQAVYRAKANGRNRVETAPWSALSASLDTPSPAVSAGAGTD